VRHRAGLRVQKRGIARITLAADCIASVDA
jgi:hypothetical protein